VPRRTRYFQGGTALLRQNSPPLSTSPPLNEPVIVIRTGDSPPQSEKPLPVPGYGVHVAPPFYLFFFLSFFFGGTLFVLLLFCVSVTLKTTYDSLVFQDSFLSREHPSYTNPKQSPVAPGFLRSFCPSLVHQKRCPHATN